MDQSIKAIHELLHWVKQKYHSRFICGICSISELDYQILTLDTTKKPLSDVNFVILVLIVWTHLTCLSREGQGNVRIIVV